MWGTCLGLLEFVLWESDVGKNIIVELLSSLKESLTLDFMDIDPSTTKMFGELGAEAYYFEEEAMTAHNHYYGIDYE